MYPRLTRLLLAASLTVATVTAVMPMPAQGYQLMGFGWATDRNLSYCFGSSGSGGFTDNQKNTIRNGFARWNGKANISVYEDCGFGGLFYDITVTISNINAVATGGCNAASGSWTDHSGRTLSKCTAGIVIFDTSIDSFYWGDSPDDCVMIAGSCKRDGKTIATHEMGHVLGLDHVTTPSCNQGHFVGTIWFPYTASDYVAACNTNGEKMMSPYAGNEGDWFWGVPQGFRHLNLHSDDINGLESIYGG